MRVHVPASTSEHVLEFCWKPRCTARSSKVTEAAGRCRQREAASSGPAEAAKAAALVPCALSYIPLKLEPWQWSVLAHEEKVKAALLT